MLQKGAPEPNRYIVKYTCICAVYARQRRRRLAFSNTMSTLNPQDAAILFSRLRLLVVAGLGVAFLILALSGNLALGSLLRAVHCIRRQLCV